MTPKQYTKDEAEALRKRVLDAAEEAKEYHEKRFKHYHRKTKKKEYRFKKKEYKLEVIVPADGDIKKWLFS